ncbi:MAG: His/Gly/Thr/Pro-type tRNA ligase C-terminal domain-containing protein, partial [Rickettsiales bacterium]
SVLRFNLSDVLPYLQVEILWHGKLAKRLEKAAKNGASHVVILSPDEEKEGACIVKNMATREEKKVFFEDLMNEETLANIFSIK